MAKAVLLRGSGGCFDLLDGTGVEALAVHRDGVVLATPARCGAHGRPAAAPPNAGGSMTSQLWWYMARSAGITAWVLVTASGADGDSPSAPR